MSNECQANRIVCWFSCGAASAVATKLALTKYKNQNVVVAYCDTGAEHHDNKRFLNACADWFGCEIQVLKNPKYKDIWDVYKQTNYLVGPIGARCSLELKKKVREQFERLSDIQIFGFTSEEAKRANRFSNNNPKVLLESPLIDRGLTKRDCKNILKSENIDIPMMYQLGYKNNNCIGCVKGAKGYWNKIRIDFPAVFERMSKEERRLNIAINMSVVNLQRQRIFLDELLPNAGNYKEEPDTPCGFSCQDALSDIWDDDDCDV